MLFLGQKWPTCPEQFFLVKTIIITFIYLLVLFIVQNLKKFLQWIPSYADVLFLGPKWSIYPQTIFLGEIINIIFIYLLAPSTVQNLKKFFQRIQTMCNFWAQNGPFSQTRIFSENLLLSLVPFIHVYLYARNQSQILIY